MTDKETVTAGKDQRFHLKGGTELVLVYYQMSKVTVLTTYLQAWNEMLGDSE